MRLAAAELVRSSHASIDAESAAARKSTAAYMLATASLAESAEEMLRESLRVQSAGPIRSLVVSRLRLCQVIEQLGRNADAVLEAREALAVVRRDPDFCDLLDFALHHLGKTLVAAGEMAQGMGALAEALVLRQCKADEARIKSTQMALGLAAEASLPREY